jgi:hypothetical protein
VGWDKTSARKIVEVDGVKLFFPMERPDELNRFAPRTVDVA